ncbi:transcription factor Opi1-domain-containing protein [Absidia repens]|uniref:Transcription factor Opi1-domain-containing protein n=1 Tax=Absidia repens TaxID=90262 RepID=A0A1X2IQL6_9FUNG|nr:transcription factor Opi1-domain-containing protein [Absidia repens]
MSQSPMSITQLCNNEEQQPPLSEQQQQQKNSVDSRDPEVRLAAEALGDLAQSNNHHSSKIAPIVLPPISTISAPSTTPSSPSITTPSGFNPSARQSFSSEDDQGPHFTSDPSFSSSATPPQQQRFIRRVSNHPLVHSALRAYESSKASSPVVKYGAEMVESIASPIYGKFGRPSSTETNNQDGHYYPNDDDMTTAATTALANTSLSEPPQETSHRRGKHSSRDDSLPLKQKTTSRSVSPHRPYPVSANAIHNQRRSSRSSRWQQLVVHAGSAAGTTAAVISAESMKCLKYCLSWLQYATQHIEQQMHLLRDVLVAMVTRSSSTSTTVSTNNNDPSGALAAIKKEVIETLRKVVEVISKYAGAGLPEHAAGTVRSFILALPSRWALLNSTMTSTTTTTTTNTTRKHSPLTSPTLGPHASPELQDTSIKLLNFGSESVEMLQSVSTIFSGTIRSADVWLDRLHSVGVTRHSNASAGTKNDHETTSPPPSTIAGQQQQQQQPSDTNSAEPMETS